MGVRGHFGAPWYALYRESLCGSDLVFRRTSIVVKSLGGHSIELPKREYKRRCAADYSRHLPNLVVLENVTFVMLASHGRVPRPPRPRGRLAVEGKPLRSLPRSIPFSDRLAGGGISSGRCPERHLGALRYRCRKTSGALPCDLRGLFVPLRPYDRACSPASHSAPSLGRMGLPAHKSATAYVICNRRRPHA